MHRARELIAALFGLVLVCLWTYEARAIAPPYVSDEELAKYPIIVVAKWDKAPFKSHRKYESHRELGRVVIRSEAYTRINIAAVIRGKVEPGEHDLMVNVGIAWGKDGTYVNSGTSTQLLGDVDDITKPCLWFLQRKRSWDERLKDEYLTVGNYREVQLLEFKEFYIALGNGNAQTQVPKLLAADKPLVAQRVLRHLCGGIWPWPYDGGWEYDKPREHGKPLRNEAGRVWDYLQTANDERPLAASVYAELAGKDGLSHERVLLDDRDPNVRGIAVGVLARHRDEASLDRFAKAAQGLADAAIACQVIKELAGWQEERTVSTLIGFLQNDAFAYQVGDDLGIPALKAQQALLAITGHAFPFDVETAQKAWQEAERVGGKAERKRLLEQLAPGGQAPLGAEAVGLPSQELSEALKKEHHSLKEGHFVIAIRVRNVSPRPVTILRAPSAVEYSWPGGISGGRRPTSDEEKLEFITLEPNASVELEQIVSEGFLISEPAERRLQLSYLANGKHQGLKAWIGTINVEFGADWAYKREVKQVEETWKNGNLKSTGTTVNGVKYGAWNFFNEQGDRIKIVYYGVGRGMATCNPEHPENKGAGKRKPK